MPARSSQCVQSLATGLDEDFRKPKNLAEQVVRLIDDDSVVSPDRLRLVMLYLLYRNGLFPADTQKLLAHARLPPRDGSVIDSLEHLGARAQKPLKDTKPAPASMFAKANTAKDAGEGYALSRFSPALKVMLEQHLNGTLDPTVFPYTKPPADGQADYSNMNGLASQASLRSAKPTWAKSRSAAAEPRQRIIVLMAGGATYAESRACYEISQSGPREVFLATSHMLAPALFLRQLGDLAVDRRRLDLPADRPPIRPPQHLFEPDPALQPKQDAPPARPNPSPLPPTPAPNPNATAAALGAMRLNSHGSGSGSGIDPNGSLSQHLQRPGPSSAPKPPEKKDKEKGEKKKKHHFFSSKK